MAENDQNNDEYLFGDLDAVSPESTDAPLEEDASKTYDVPSIEGKNNMRRNAFIVVSVVVLSLVVYSFFGNKTPYKEKVTTTKTRTTIQPPVQAVVDVPDQPVVVSPPVEQVNTNSSQMNDKIAAVESSQQTIQSEVSTINTQVVGVSNNVSTIMDKMAELNQVIAQLNTKVDEQTLIIERLMARAKPKPVRSRRLSSGIKNPRYFVQAVIPGRAWLIATNGSTLTVREGSLIRGYGMVKLIDPTQGRVMTSSGQVIRFNQDDS